MGRVYALIELDAALDRAALRREMRVGITPAALRQRQFLKLANADMEQGKSSACITGCFPVASQIHTPQATRGGRRAQRRNAVAMWARVGSAYR